MRASSLTGKGSDHNSKPEDGLKKGDKKGKEGDAPVRFLRKGSAVTRQID